MCVKLSTIPKGISGKNLELLEPKYEDGSNKSVRVMLWAGVGHPGGGLGPK